MMETTAKTITNPYPEWQRSSDINCWRCYVLLWRREQVERHLCDECHVAGFVAVNDDEDKGA
jgi:hypothetical protein